MNKALLRSHQANDVADGLINYLYVPLLPRKKKYEFHTPLSLFNL